MIETIKYKDQTYPKFQSEGFAARFAIPYAQQVCKGVGYDIGCNRLEWSLPNSIAIDPLICSDFDAHKLPTDHKVDYIFSSHCLEHLDNWVDALDHWSGMLKSGGTLFLYLPDYSQHYWRCWNNRKHKNTFTAEIIRDYMNDNGYKNIFTSGVDLNNSFMCMGEKI